MIARRRCPKQKPFSAAKPSPSGPRWASTVIMRRTWRWRSAWLAEGPTIPLSPHMAGLRLSGPEARGNRPGAPDGGELGRGRFGGRGIGRHEAALPAAPAAGHVVEHGHHEIAHHGGRAYHLALGSLLVVA